jgi:hypothetical protein
MFSIQELGKTVMYETNLYAEHERAAIGTDFNDLNFMRHTNKPTP